MNKKNPMRRCIGCGQSKDKKDLIRIVKNKNGEIFLDAQGKANGRGAYLCKDEKCLEAAMKKRKLNQAFRSEISEDVYDRLKEEWKQIEQ